MNESQLLFIFDLDGTLTDSNAQIASCLNKARSELSYAILDDQFYLQNIGLPVDVLISDLSLNSFERQNLISKFRDFLIADIEAGNNKLFQGVEEAFFLISKFGSDIAIATNKPTKIAAKVVGNTKLSGFKIHIQGVDDLKPKPSPDIVLAVLRLFPDQIPVMVGDRVEDMEAARTAGVRCVGITSGPHSDFELKKAGASLVFESFEIFSNYLSSECNLFLNLLR